MIYATHLVLPKFFKSRKIKQYRQHFLQSPKVCGYRRYQLMHTMLISASKCRRLHNVGRSRVMQADAHQMAPARIATLSCESLPLEFGQN